MLRALLRFAALEVDEAGWTVDVFFLLSINYVYEADEGLKEVYGLICTDECKAESFLFDTAWLN